MKSSENWIWRRTRTKSSENLIWRWTRTKTFEPATTMKSLTSMQRKESNQGQRSDCCMRSSSRDAMKTTLSLSR